jgi:hypothetical protein
MMNKPTSIDLGYLHLPIVYDANLIAGDSLGEFQAEKSRIVISDTISGMVLLDTLNHEIKHAMWYLGEIKEADAGEEFAVSVLGHLETELQVRNPHLLKWIASVAKGNA